MAANVPLCSVVLINYNGKTLLERFLPSVNNLNYPNYEVIIVDNASADDSIDFIEKTYSQFKLIKHNENSGTAEGSNIGAREAKGEYVFWISNDMELDPDILNHMINRCEADPKIGICTCKMRRITEEGVKLNILDSVASDLDIYGFPAARGINQEDKGQLDFYTEVFFSFGGALLIKREVLEKTEGYDSKVFTLADDIDLSWRTHLLGYKVVVEPRAFLYHRVSATLGTTFGRSQKRFISERNTLRMLLKNYASSTLVTTLPRYFILLFMEMIFFALLGKFQIAKSGLRAIAWNIADLKDILARRKKIQQTRVVQDSKIQKLMLKNSQKIVIFKDYMKNYQTPEWKAYFGEASKQKIS